MSDTEKLIRLPAESLFRYKCVCKEWLRIIDDPSFIKEHTNNQLYSHTILARHRSGALVYSLSLDSINFNDGPQMIEATQVKKLFRRDMPRLPPFFQIAFCNGLILLTQTVESWAIWNPISKELHKLHPPVADSMLWSIYGLGLGYDCVADDYKVVKITQLWPTIETAYQTLIYSLRSNSWSEVENCPGPCSPRLGASFNGSLYWISHDTNTIVALNLGTGSYSQLPLPPVDIGLEIRKMVGFGFGFGFYLDSLDDSLICSFNYRQSEIFDAWVMKDNGVEKSWIKLFSVQYWRFFSHKVYKMTGELRLVAYLKSKQQVVLQHDWGFLWIDIGNNSTKKFSIHGLPYITSARICPGSLVRLNGRAIEGAVRRPLTKKRKGKTEGTDTRFKVCIRDKLELCCSDNYNCTETSCRSVILGESSGCLRAEFKCLLHLEMLWIVSMLKNLISTTLKINWFSQFPSLRHSFFLSLIPHFVSLTTRIQQGSEFF